TLKLSGMAGSEEGQILFEGLGVSGRIRYDLTPGRFIIQPDATTSSGQAIITPFNCRIHSQLYVTPNEHPVWHAGNLNLSTFSFTPTLGGNNADPTVTYGTRAGRYARVGPLVFVYV